MRKAVPHGLSAARGRSNPAPCRRTVLVVAILAGWGLFGPVPNARAVPRFSARYEQNCVLCHASATGGGLRSLYATQYLVPAEMSYVRYTPEQMSAIEPQISKTVTVGVDLRTMRHLADRKEIAYDNNLLMEGTVYLGIQLNPRFFAVVERTQSASGEIYGQGFILPYGGYVKVGRFTPAFGWRFDDHTQFVRLKAFQPGSAAGPSGVGDLDGPPAPNLDVGWEVGISPGRLALTAALVNGNPGSIQDDNDKVAYALQGLYRAHVSHLGLGLGGSLWHNDQTAGKQTNAGPYGYVKLGDLIWLGEFDWSSFNPIEAGRTFTGLTVSQELTYRIHRGLDLRATYDFSDPDTDKKNGARTRIGGGLDFMPYPFLELLAMVDVHRFDAGELALRKDYTQLQAQVHFFY